MSVLDLMNYFSISGKSKQKVVVLQLPGRGGGTVLYGGFSSSERRAFLILCRPKKVFVDESFSLLRVLEDILKFVFFRIFLMFENHQYVDVCCYLLFMLVFVCCCLYSFFG